jgi:tetratricopeptide (TPR) repeat protein
MLNPIEWVHMLDTEFHKCDLDSCSRRMRKVRTGRCGITLTKQQMLEGFGGAEECQNCRALHCDACYPHRENVCLRCHERALRLVMVQYEIGTTGLWPQRPGSLVTRDRAGSNWAINLRKFLATQSQSYLEAASTQLGAELAAMPASRSLLPWASVNTERSALRSAWSTIQKVAVEDRSPAASESVATARLFRKCGRNDDAESIRLIGPDWDVRMGQSYLMAPPHLQDRILSSGLDACSKCAEIARSLGDVFCEAEYLTRLGNGLYSVRRFEKAEEAFSEALHLWRGLALQNPELLGKVGRTLMHLGTVYKALGEFTRCAASNRDAIEILADRGDCQRDLAFTLNNLGNFYLHRREYEQARSSFERACATLEALIRSGVTRSTEDPHSPLLSIQLPKSRTNLALCMSELGDLNRAEDLIRQAIGEEEGLIAVAGDRLRMNIAKTRAELGRVLLRRWLSTRNRGGVPDEQLLDAATVELSIATTTFRQQLSQSNSSAYLQSIVEAFISFGLSFGFRRDFGSAANVIDEACELARGAALWLERSRAFDARRDIEVLRSGDPLAGFEWARRAVQTAEAAMAELSEAERGNRDLVKGRIEMSYLCYVANLARRDDHAGLFDILEAMRRIDRLAKAGRGGRTEIDLHSATLLATKHNFTYIASQAAPGGTVFLVIEPGGKTSTGTAAQGWAERAYHFSGDVDDSARAYAYFGEPDIDALKLKATCLFDELPSNAQRGLLGEKGPIFLSMGGDQHNLPVELFYAPGGGWLGLQRVHSRVRSFEELATILERRPTLSKASAVVAAGPGDGYERIFATARSAGDRLVAAGFSLYPEKTKVMTGADLTRWKFLDSIDREPSAILFVGHGGHDGNGAFCQVSDTERLRPSDLAQLWFDSAPVVHLECCTAGEAIYFGGGYWDSYAVSLLAIGASCCLVSNRLVFGSPSELLCKELYAMLSGTEALPIGIALLQARRRTANAYPNPLCWVAPVLHGNPLARIREAEC